MTNDDAACVRVVGQNGMGPGTALISAAALARYVKADAARMTGSHAQCADCKACQLLPTCASCGRMK